MYSLYMKDCGAFLRYYELPGSGPVHVYLPGLSTSSLVNFIGVVSRPEMAGKHSLLVDYLGSGFSDHPVEFNHSIEHHARSIAELLDYAGYKDCVIIGQSMGGTVGIMLALLRPDLVARLIVSEANVENGGGDGSRFITSWTEQEFLDHGYQETLAAVREKSIKGDRLASVMAGAWQAADPRGLYRCADALVNGLPEDFKHSFCELPIPRAFIYGERSLPENIGKILADVPDREELSRRGVRVYIVPDAGHGMIFENLPGYIKALQSALED